MSKSNIFIYRHDDVDGETAAAIVYQKIREKSDIPVDSLAINYPDKFPMGCFDNEDTECVFLVDISFGLDTVKQLKTLCLDKCEGTTKVIWIDHHKTSLDMIEEKKAELDAIPNLKYAVNTKVCGALLTYLYFHSPLAEWEFQSTIEWTQSNNSILLNINKSQVEVAIPKMLLTIDDYDCWKGKYNYTDNIILGLSAMDTNYKSDLWKRAFKPTLDRTVAELIMELNSDGTLIHKYLNKRYSEDLEEGAFEIAINGLSTLVINTRGNSWCFQEHITKYPFVILYTMEKDGKYYYSIYKDMDKFADNMSCTRVATAYGGGGHPGASGFQSTYPMFKPINQSLKHKVFLGGTCVDGCDWRTPLIASLDRHGIDSFNPVVKEWNEEAKKTEEEEKNDSLIHLYTVVPQMTGSFSIAEVIESVNNHPGITIFCCPRSYKDKSWTDSQYNSMKSIAKLVRLHGGYVCDGLGDILDSVIYSIGAVRRNYFLPEEKKNI